MLNAEIMNVNCEGAEKGNALPSSHLYLYLSSFNVLDFVSYPLFNARQICSKDLFIVFNCPFLPHHCDIENVIKQHVHRMINPKKHLPHQSCSFCHRRERGRGQATNILVLVKQSSSRSPGEQP